MALSQDFKEFVALLNSNNVRYLVVVEVDVIPVNFISRADLKKNKRASGRHQDLADLDNLA